MVCRKSVLIPCSLVLVCGLALLTLQRGMLHGRPRRVLRRASRSSPDRARAAAAAAASAPSDGTFTPQAKLPASALAELQPPKLGRNGHGSATPAPASVSVSDGLEAYTAGGSEYRCEPSPEARGTRPLDHVVAPEASEWPQNCEGREELCDVLRKTAVRREVLVAVCNSNVIGQLDKWVESNRRAGITNMLIVAIDDRLPKHLDSAGVAYWKRINRAAGSHKISAQKFMYVKEFLTTGCSVLMSDIDVVYLRNPFDYLHRDSDIEGTTDGWDDGSAYGWTEQLDDPSLGPYGRFRPAMRITAWNSGLWYARATHASLNLMSILAQRMATEDTWDQAAFGEEVARPARDDHLAAGITKRALNHWCFANSKTTFRRIRVEPQLKAHVPVVVHANYHQPKEPRMRAVYDRWHLNQPDALDRFHGEQAFTVPAPQLEQHFLHSINDGFVSGANTQAASAATASGGCAPKPSKHGVTVGLHRLPAALPCVDADLCAAARKAAGCSAEQCGAGAELLLVVGAAADAPALTFMLKSAARAGVSRKVLVVATDAALAAALRQSGAVGDATVVERPADGGGGALALAHARYAALLGVLAAGIAVLSALPATLLVSDPFAALYRDSDIEAMSAGWDDGSAYGYNHVLDDPSMGFTRFCHGSRIVAYEPGLFYAQPTAEAVALLLRLRLRLDARLTATATASEVASVEREVFLHELWLPSHHNYTSVGAVLRVMNYLCFANSKVAFRQLRHNPKITPVVVQLNYHSDFAPRMEALYTHYVERSGSSKLKDLPLADEAGAASAVRCDPASSREGAPRRLDTTAARLLISESPYAWGGVGDMVFNADGSLQTPWGVGQWGAHPDAEDHVFADFVGAKHNVKLLPSGLGVSTRCADKNTVLLRSIKAAKLAAK